jgi:tripartite-type tricarboxylate transporter receptor subunit TctC
MDRKIAYDWLARAATALAFAAAAGPLAAQQDYPVKPIRFILGVAPGGATDILARAIGAKMAENLRQQVIIDNRPGANHIIGGELTAKSPKDGYTIQMIPEGWVINASVYAKLPFDPLRDFSPIAIVALVPNVLVIHPSINARSVKSFIAFARARPGQMSTGSSGVGSPSHMSGELFKVMTGIEWTHVPYRGQSLAVIDMISGQIQLGFPSIPASVAHIKSGRLVALGVTTTQRASALPEVPAISEAGLPGYEVSGWYGVIGPAGIPGPLVARINQEINGILKAPDMRDRLLKEGAEPRTGTPEEFAAAMANDLQKWAKVVKSAGLKPQ